MLEKLKLMIAQMFNQVVWTTESEEFKLSQLGDSCQIDRTNCQELGKERKITLDYLWRLTLSSCVHNTFGKEKMLEKGQQFESFKNISAKQMSFGEKWFN